MMLVQALFVPAFAQKAEEPYGSFISSTFAHYRMELPKLAWLVPPRTIIATEKTPAIWIWSESEHLTRAEYRGKLTPAELRRFRQTEGIACARAAEHDRYELSKADVNTGGDSSDEQHGDAVFYTSKSGVRIISDATMTDTSDEELSRAGRLFGIIDRATRSKGFNVMAGDYTFTFAGFYDEESGEMFAAGLVLSDRKAGRTMASHSWDVSTDTVCEGCQVPQYDEPLEDNFGLLNLIRVPHFPYPLLLEDSGTDDEDALSLVTFSPQATYCEYRVYESFDGCDDLALPQPVIAGTGPRVDRRRDDGRGRAFGAR